MTAILVHPLDPARVEAAVVRKVADIERNRQNAYRNLAETLASYARTQAEGQRWRGARVPQASDQVELAAHYDQEVVREQTHYARVRVVEDTAPANADKPFFLVYGDHPNEGPHRTGGFASAQDAENWFMNLGR